MFMEKIDLPRVTCDLFGVTKGFEGNGGAGVDTGKGPRMATMAEAKAYADFIRRKNGLPEIGNPRLHHVGGYTGRGRTCAFHYVGATYGEETDRAGYNSDTKQKTPAQYETGAFSVLFPGANQLRPMVTLDTLDEAGEVVSSQTLPVEPKKGGVVWSKDDVRKAAGPVAKVKAARTPTRIRRAPTVDKRRRAVLMALRLRTQLRISRDIAHDRLCQLAEISRQNAAKRTARLDVPAMAPDAILSDLAAAEAMMRGEGYVSPADDTLREGLRIVLHCGSYEGLRATVYSNGAGYGWGALTDCGRHVSVASYGTPDRGWSLCPTVDEAAPAPTAIQAKRTPAHERAIRRAWAERKGAREYRTSFLMHRDARNAADDAAKGLTYDLDRAKAARDRMEAEALRVSDICRERDAQLAAAQDQARLAESIAEDHLQMREEVQRVLRATEARLAAAEAENAQLWAEIETLTAPAAAIAA